MSKRNNVRSCSAARGFIIFFLPTQGNTSTRASLAGEMLPLLGSWFSSKGNTQGHNAQSQQDIAGWDGSGYALTVVSGPSNGTPPQVWWHKSRVP